MSIPIRHSYPDSVIASERTFFVTSSTWGRQRLLQSDKSAGLFIVVLYEYRAQGKYQLQEFVVMPDHFHVLLTVGAQMTVERAVQFIKGGFAFRAGKELGMRAPIWQKGFSQSRVHDEESFMARRAYIRNNPVAASLAEEPEKYVYSSAYGKFELDALPQRLKPVSLVASLARLKPCPDTSPTLGRVEETRVKSLDQKSLIRRSDRDAGTLPIQSWLLNSSGIVTSVVAAACSVAAFQ